MNKLIFRKKLLLCILGRSFRDGKVITLLQLAQKWNLPTKFWQNVLFYQHSPTLYDIMQKEIENLEFVQGVNFQYMDSFKNNGTKNLLIFHDSCEEICNSKAIVDIATAGKHRGLSTFYIKNNLFHQTKLGRDLQLHNTRSVLFKSPRDVMWCKSVRLVHNRDSDQS